MTNQFHPPNPNSVSQLRERIREEGQALDGQLQAIARNVEEFRRRLSGWAEAWDAQLSALQDGRNAEPGLSSGRDRKPQPVATQPGPPVEASEDEQKLQQEARRYARLLVAEIELYHPEEVAQGRVNKDLYARLRPHIELSRQAYESRFSRQMSEYYHEELVRTLAHNDSTLLGSEYPAPTE